MSYTTSRGFRSPLSGHSALSAQAGDESAARPAALTFRNRSARATVRRGQDVRNVTGGTSSWHAAGDGGAGGDEAMSGRNERTNAQAMVNGDGSATNAGLGKAGIGLTVRRFYTREGEDPFASAQWTKRTSRITNPDGSVVFEMADAEIPASWSQVAADLMVSKYFRKAGVPQQNGDGDPIVDDAGNPVLGPERSARQVFHRLA